MASSAANPQEEVLEEAGASGVTNLGNDRQSKVDLFYDTFCELLEENVFNCDSCGTLLKPPVYYAKIVGTVCESCMDVNNWDINPLEKFNIVLRSIPIVPCTNEKCEAHILDGNLECHLKDGCKYRSVKCIYGRRDKCSWKGLLEDLISHFEAKHKSHVIDNDTFTFKMDLGEESFVISKLLIKSYCKFFVLLKREKNSGDVFYRVFTDSKVENVSLKHFGDGNRYFILNVDTAPMKMVDKEMPYVKINAADMKECLELGKIEGQSDILTLFVEIPTETVITEVKKLFNILPTSTLPSDN